MSGISIHIRDPQAVSAARTAIVVPARDEALHIAACLESLAAQQGHGGIAVYLCVNNTRDATAAIAMEVARDRALPLVLAQVDIPRGGVGRARRIGHLLVGRHGRRTAHLLSTDADCVADAGWVRAMERGLTHAPAVLGRIDVTAQEAAAFSPGFHAAGQLEASYLGLSLEFEHLLDPSGSNRIGLNTAGGANIGFRAAIYRQVGGFASLPAREDRDLVDRIIAAGHVPVRVPDAVIYASMRAQGRAPGGMAEAIADRLANGDCALDTALAPLDAMLARHLGHAIAARRLSISDALRDLGPLADCVARLRGIDDVPGRRAFIASLAAEAAALPPHCRSRGRAVGARA